MRYIPHNSQYIPRDVYLSHELLYTLVMHILQDLQFINYKPHKIIRNYATFT